MNQDMIASLQNPRYALPGPTTDLSVIALDCVINGVPGVFVASPNDPETFGVEVWKDCMAGTYGPIGPYVEPPETVNQAVSRQTNEVQIYLQAAMMPRPPSPDRQMIHSEIQAATTTQGYHFFQIPQPWDRPVTEADQVHLDAGLAAYAETVDYLNAQIQGRKLPPFKLKSGPKEK